jgi:hypothetical protein
MRDRLKINRIFSIYLPYFKVLSKFVVQTICVLHYSLVKNKIGEWIKQNSLTTVIVSSTGGFGISINTCDYIRVEKENDGYGLLWFGNSRRHNSYVQKILPKSCFYYCSIPFPLFYFFPEFINTYLLILKKNLGDQIKLIEYMDFLRLELGQENTNWDDNSTYNWYRRYYSLFYDKYKSLEVNNFEIAWLNSITESRTENRICFYVRYKGLKSQDWSNWIRNSRNLKDIKSIIESEMFSNFTVLIVGDLNRKDYKDYFSQNKKIYTKWNVTKTQRKRFELISAAASSKFIGAVGGGITIPTVFGVKTLMIDYNGFHSSCPNATVIYSLAFDEFGNPVTPLEGLNKYSELTLTQKLQYSNIDVHELIKLIKVWLELEDSDLKKLEVEQKSQITSSAIFKYTPNTRYINFKAT